MARTIPLFWISSLLLFSAVTAAEKDKDKTKTDPNKIMIDEMLGYIDESVDPCKNFRNYSAKYIPEKSLIAKMQNLFDELKDNDFDEVSLEGKVKRFYNICLTSYKSLNYSELGFEERTVQELENTVGLPVSKYLGEIYGVPIPPSAKVIIWSSEDINRIKTLCGDVGALQEIKFLLSDTIIIPTLERYRGCATSAYRYLREAAKLIYEERVLGPEKVSWFQTQVQNIFEAIRQQLQIRVQRNSLNWTTSEISDLQESLKKITLSFYSIPEKVNHRDYVTDFYKELNFSIDDDYDSVVAKASEFLNLKNASKLDQNLNTLHGGHEIIFDPYIVMPDTIFENETHDIFRMAPVGFNVAYYIFDFYKDNICSQHNGTLFKMFDDHQVLTIDPFCSQNSESEELLAAQQITVIILNLVHEAYFAPGSPFSQVQPSFTTKTLSQLSWLKLAQTITEQLGIINELLDNLLPKVPSLAKAFGCHKNLT